MTDSKKYTAAIMITGSEFSLGLKRDSNSQLIANFLSRLGISVSQILLAPDEQTALVASLNFLSVNNDVVIISGGLGPTQDDLTRFAVAEFAQKKLVQDLESLRAIEELFRIRNRPLFESNKLQTMFPETAQIIKNSLGTAPGFAIKNANTLVVALPGVPSELDLMLNDSVSVLLKNEFSDLKNRKSACIRLFGLPESQVGEIVAALKLPVEIDVCYQASFPEIQVILSAEDEKLLADHFAQISKALGEDLIFSNSLLENLESVVHKKLIQNNLSLACAESCTGGMLGALITSNPEASNYFRGSLVCYQNEVKTLELNIAPSTINEFGAVSKEVTEKMAQAVQKKLDTDYALAITGFAGPAGDDSARKLPVGTFFIALANRSSVESKQLFFKGSRTFFQRYACYSALQLLRRHLSS